MHNYEEKNNKYMITPSYFETTRLLAQASDCWILRICTSLWRTTPPAKFWRTCTSRTDEEGMHSCIEKETTRLPLWTHTSATLSLSSHTIQHASLAAFSTHHFVSLGIFFFWLCDFMWLFAFVSDFKMLINLPF